MRILHVLFTVLLLLALAFSTFSCTSKSGKLAEQREMAAIEAKLDAELEAQKQMEIERGYDAVIIIYADASYKMLNDSVVMRVEDNVFFHKRPAPKGMKNTSAFRYYRVF
jgi:hypothetical protein